MDKNTSLTQEIFKGLSYEESVEVQLREWVKGNSIHNTVGNECCPDFSCCHPELLMSEEVRIKFADAHKRKDNLAKSAILGMAVSSLISKIKDGPKVHIAGEDTTVH